MHIESTLKEAHRHFNAGQFAQAAAICREILQRQPKQPDALHLLGITALQGGKHREASELIRQAIRYDAGNSSYYVNLGECCRVLGRLDEAISLYQRALEIDPRRAEAYCNLGSVQQAQGKNAEAMGSYRRALELNPKLAQAHYNKGNLHSEQGEVDAAIAAYRRAIDVVPNFADAHYNLGNLLSKLGQHRAAADTYEQATAFAPRFASSWFNLGNSFRKLEKLEDARRAYLSALEIDPSLWEAHLHLGTTARLQGRLEQALECLGRALEAAPDSALAHAEMAHVLVLQGKTDAAIAACRNAIDLDPSLIWGHVCLSTAYAAADRISEARSATRQVVDIARVFPLPFLGRQPIGRVLVLKGVEDGHFTIGDHETIRLDLGLNNADVHFDKSKYFVTDFLVDGLEPGMEREALPECDVIFNAVSDVDCMPRCQEIVERIARGTPVPIINHPAAVAKTQRHRNYQALHDLDGIVFPKTVRVERPLGTSAEVAALLEEEQLTLPVLIRRVGTHSGETLEKADSIEQLQSYLATHSAQACYITEFLDFARISGEYLKMRMFIVDGDLFPSMLFISDDWFVRVDGRSKGLMLANAWMREESEHFMRDPQGYLGQDAFRALASIYERLPLDYFGIDFTRLPDGRILVFEANPVMRLPFPNTTELNDFSFRKPSIEMIERELQRLLENRISRSRNNRD